MFFCVGGFAIPVHRLRLVLFDAPSLGVAVAEQTLGGAVSLFRGLAKPFHCFRLVFFDADPAVQEQAPEVALRRGIAEFGGGPEVFCRRFEVFGIAGCQPVLIDLFRLDLALQVFDENRCADEQDQHGKSRQRPAPGDTETALFASGRLFRRGRRPGIVDRRSVGFHRRLFPPFFPVGNRHKAQKGDDTCQPEEPSPNPVFFKTFDQADGDETDSHQPGEPPRESQKVQEPVRSALFPFGRFKRIIV